MAVLNKPENRKTNEAHDLGQISIKTLLNRIAEERNWIEHEETACAEQGIYYAGQQDMLDRITVFLMARSNQEPEIREGMTEFVGPPRRVWVWVERNNGQDPRTMTGGETYRLSGFRSDFRFTIDHLDAPTRIAAGSTQGNITAKDPNRNVFPTTTYRDFF